jgi:hypothetical protein
MDLNILFDDLCTLKFIYPDGSIVECISTLNRNLLRLYGLDGIDGLVDLLSSKPIPSYLLDKLTEIHKGANKDLDPLDLLLESGTRLGW